MKIHILRGPATREQVSEMLEALHTYIKVAVDVDRELVAGGGEWHADCEQLLLNDGSRQQDVWGADWYPNEKQVRCEALINIRPRQNNRSLRIQDATLRKRVEGLVRSTFEAPQ